MARSIDWPICQDCNEQQGTNRACRTCDHIADLVLGNRRTSAPWWRQLLARCKPRHESEEK